jgi:hypothetical protein
LLKLEDLASTKDIEIAHITSKQAYSIDHHGKKNYLPANLIDKKIFNDCSTTFQDVSILTRPADEFGNDSMLEELWARKAFEHAETHFNLLCSVGLYSFNFMVLSF